MTASQKLMAILAGPKLFNAVLPVLMLYLLAGTVAQKYIGLYEATRIFFSGPVLWFGLMPLPGLPLLLALIALNLTLKLILKSPWNLYTSGTIIIHLGVLLLLVGGLFTAITGEDGYIDLYPGTEKSYVSDYHDRELVLLDEDDNVMETYDFEQLSPGRKLHVTEPPVILKIVETCRNCEISLREDAPPEYKGMAAKMKISPGRLKKQDEENLAGLTVEVKGTQTDGTYLTLDEVPKLPELEVKGQTLKLALRKSRRALPFSVRLLSFRRELHPGTDMAKSYESHIEIIDGQTRWETLVSMNQPVRYKGYTLFQSSFVQTPAGIMSVLAAVKNTGRVFPYISGLAVCFGLILHLLIRAGVFNRRRRRSAFFILALSLTVSFGAKAQDTAPPLPMEEFAKLPILHEGRIKPLDSFARATLKKISGKERIGDRSAIEWLAETLFNPSSAEKGQIIKITDPELRSLLNLSLRPGHLYSPKEVTRNLADQFKKLPQLQNMDVENLSPSQRALLDLNNRLILLNNVISGLSLFLPLSAMLPDDVPESLKLFAGRQISYLDTLKFSRTLDEELKKIIKSKGNDINIYTPSEQSIAYLSFSTAGLAQAGERSTLLRIIPAQSSESDLWQSPWTVALQGSGTPRTAELFSLWKNLAAAYQSGERDQWTKTLEKIYGKTRAQYLTQGQQDRLEAEFHYNRIAPFYIAFLLFLLGALSLAAASATQNAFPQKISFFFLALGVVAQIIGLSMRIYILQRPPVSTLYESIIFVTAVTTLYALIMSAWKKDSIWPAMGITAGIILGLLGFAHDSDSDNLMMLTAVLNTNFWLATHVLCITIGYGFSLLSAFLAHWALAVMIRNRTATPPAELYKTLYTTALIALLFCAGGTILGGIWADQSWGRFWGWDPKENGALLLVLWLIWIIHGRLGGQLSPLGFTAGMAYTLAIVAVSWFGVNLLSVGLHAYGFTEAAAWIFWSVLLLETLTAGGSVMILRHKGTKSVKREKAA
ncbi:MAG: cytochrome c biogenesis protein CcsA [Alphaproteobacteria bacterium]|nr:cytochrome c biogenesis protein CcsA [Alphaproteobacteria bacterium]MCB9974901.1 cytochrome c biogenesis protein CcsA [Rhodospirillales bacterium]